MKDNLTLSILLKAEKEGYGVIAQACYDMGMVQGLVRSCERNKAPGILQMFPITLQRGGAEWLQFCLDSAHNASVPIAVHLDHATDAEHLELAIGFAERQGIKFDSIMVDASHADSEEENIAIAVPYIKRCVAQGISTEVELGRLEGGEAGVREITGEMLTEPNKAEVFMRETGAHILAPCIGNRHGSYKPFGGPKNFRQDILKELQTRFKGRIPMAQHGTDENPDELFVECLKNGMTKINVNSWCRDPYCESLSKGIVGPKGFPDALDEAVEVFAKECDRFIKLFGSDGKA